MNKIWFNWKCRFELNINFFKLNWKQSNETKAQLVEFGIIYYQLVLLFYCSCSGCNSNRILKALMFRFFIIVELFPYIVATELFMKQNFPDSSINWVEKFGEHFFFQLECLEDKGWIRMSRLRFAKLWRVRHIITRFNFANFYGNPFLSSLLLFGLRVFHSWKNSFYYQFEGE